MWIESFRLLQAAEDAAEDADTAAEDADTVVEDADMAAEDADMVGLLLRYYDSCWRNLLGYYDVVLRRILFHRSFDY